MKEVVPAFAARSVSFPRPGFSPAMAGAAFPPITKARAFFLFPYFCDSVHRGDVVVILKARRFFL